MLSCVARPSLYRSVLEPLAATCSRHSTAQVRHYGDGRGGGYGQGQGQFDNAPASANDIIDGHVGEMTMKPRVYEAGRYPLFGDVHKTDFNKLVRGAEHRTRVHQPPMMFGDSESTWLQREIAMWEDGRIRLAKMMGVDPETFSEEDIDVALTYLLPSQLWKKTARPLMKHPLKLFPERHNSDVDMNELPKSAGFYTGSPGYNDLLYSIYQQAELIQRKMASAGFRELMEEFNQRSDDKFIWLSRQELSSKLHDVLDQDQYKIIIDRLEKIANHKLCYVATKFLKEWSKPPVEEVVVDDTSRTQYGKRMSCRAWASVKLGTGKLFVRERQHIRAGLLEAKDIGIYWRFVANRQTVLHPFVVTNTIGLFDAEIEIQRHGNNNDQPSPTAEAGAARLAISRALAVINPEYKEILKRENLLVEDHRPNIRKQPGRLKARKIGQWKKR